MTPVDAAAPHPQQKGGGMDFDWQVRSVPRVYS